VRRAACLVARVRPRPRVQNKHRTYAVVCGRRILAFPGRHRRSSRARGERPGCSRRRRGSSVAKGSSRTSDLRNVLTLRVENPFAGTRGAETPEDRRSRFQVLMRHLGPLRRRLHAESHAYATRRRPIHLRKSRGQNWSRRPRKRRRAAPPIFAPRWCIESWRARLIVASE